MPAISIVVGLVLVLLGVGGYAGWLSGGEGGRSTTALIPAYLGGALALLGLVALAAAGARKHAMHLAAVVGVVGFLGGFMPLFRSQFDFSKPSAISGLAMIVLCGGFVGLCVKSFVDARRSRAAQGGSGTP
jgi:hypothetical protein